jgi:RNA polymerase sigma-70 factor (ECF subfamily)
MEERQLIEGLIQGLPDAFRSLVEEYQGKVVNICYRFLGNEEDAEDVAQEVFVEVYRSISRFRGDSRLSTWVYRIATTKSLDAVRRKRRKKRFGKMLRLFRVAGSQEEAIPIPHYDTPEKRLEDKERAEILRKAVESLAESQRVAITLNKYEGLSYTEVAEVMGTTVSSVESLIHRAKKNLERKLHAYFKSVL